MWPIVFRVGDTALYSYTLFVSFAFFAGLGLWVWLGKPLGLRSRDQVNISLLGSAAAWIGARLLFIITQWSKFGENGSFQLWSLWQGGVVFYGGFIAGFSALYVAFPHFKIPRKLGFNSILPAITLAHAIGRVGCFLNGCCYGDHCELPWAVTYSNPYSAAPLHEPLHPVQLYEALGLIALTLILSWNIRKKNALRPLSNLIIYLGGYGLLRFGLEFVRGDRLRGFWGPFSTSQWISLAAVFASVLLAFRRRRAI